MRVFEEIQARFRSPWSESGTRFGILEPNTPEAYYYERVRTYRKDNKFQQHMDSALEEALKYGLEEALNYKKPVKKLVCKP